MLKRVYSFVSSEFHLFKYDCGNIIQSLNIQANARVTYEMCNELHKQIQKTQSECPIQGVTYADHIKERQRQLDGQWLAKRVKSSWKKAGVLTSIFGVPLSLMFMISTETPQTLFFTVPISACVTYAFVRQERKDKYLEWAIKFCALERLKQIKSV